MNGEQPEKPSAPDGLVTPGLIYRLRVNGWVLSWSPRSDLLKRGYPGRAVKLWPTGLTPLRQPEPTPDEWETVSAKCVQLYEKQSAWARDGDENNPASLFNGTIGSLIEVYQRHKKSPFKGLRPQTRARYAISLRTIKGMYGRVRVETVTFDDISRWQDEFGIDDDGALLRTRAAELTGHLKRLFLFGALVLPRTAGCHDVCDIFKKMAEGRLMGSVTSERTEYMTAAQCRLLCVKAHEMGHHSIALEQAIAFELGVRQKDVIGEWMPRAEPGVTDVIDGPRKWLLGVRWEEIDQNLILRHRLSKSLRGNKAVTDPKSGKVKAWDLRAYPMVMEELRCMVGHDVTRADLPASGPIIVSEHTGRPWSRWRFGIIWRKVAAAAGLPATLQNRDSRPGAATEADLAGAPIDKTRRGLGHSKSRTTEIYLRDDLAVNSELARLRVEKRKP